MRGGQCLSHAAGDVEHPIAWQSTLGDDPIERLTINELHGQKVDAVGLFDREDSDDIRVVDRGQRLRFAIVSEADLSEGLKKLSSLLKTDLSEPRKVIYIASSSA